MRRRYRIRRAAERCSRLRRTPNRTLPSTVHRAFAQGSQDRPRPGAHFCGPGRRSCLVRPGRTMPNPFRRERSEDREARTKRRGLHYPSNSLQFVVCAHHGFVFTTVGRTSKLRKLHCLVLGDCNIFSAFSGAARMLEHPVYRHFVDTAIHSIAADTDRHVAARPQSDVRYRTTPRYKRLKNRQRPAHP